MIVGARQGAFSISETVDLLGFSHTTVSTVSRERGKNKKHLPDWSKLMVTVTQITRHYNSGMQKSISEHTTSKWIGYCSKRPISQRNKSNKYLIKCSVNVYSAVPFKCSYILICVDIKGKYTKNFTVTLLPV